MKAFAAAIFTLFTIAGYSQTSINSYKYILVPERYNFAKEDNQYGLNTTTKQLLTAKGFTAFLNNEQLPQEVASNKCNALRAEVVEKKSMFVTKLTLLLKDCQGNILFQTKEGRSREKDFPVAYDLALRDALTSLNDLPYKYDSTAIAQTQQATTATPGATATPRATASTASPATAAMPSSPAPAPATSTAADITGTLYAQIIPNGYQLIDTTPKKVLTLLKTSADDHFIAEGGPSNGIAFKKNGDWFFEYYKEGRLVSQKLSIKF